MKQITYIESILTPYLKGVVSIDENNVIIENPNTILKFIPLGKKKTTFSVHNIASASSNFKLEFKTFIFGLLLSLISFSLFKNSFLGGLIVLIIGLINILNSFEINVTITPNSGQSTVLEFFIFEKSKACDLENTINSMTTLRQVDTNYRVQKTSTEDLLRQIANNQVSNQINNDVK